MNTRYIWFAFGIGAALGSAVALLFAPQSGIETREQLGQAFDEAADAASHYAGDTGDTLKDKATKLSAAAQTTLQQAGDKATEIVNAAAEVLEHSATQAKAATASMF